MSLSHDNTKIGPIVLVIAGLFLALFVMFASVINSRGNLAFQSRAAAHCTPIGQVWVRGTSCCNEGVPDPGNQMRCVKKAATPIPINCGYTSLSSCLNSSSCNKITHLCMTTGCGRNSQGALKARCVIKLGRGGAPPQGSECKLFNINGQQRYGCVTKEGFCPRGGNASSQFDSYCIGGVCSGTTNGCIANKWILTPSPKPTATPVEHGNRFQTCDKVSDVGSYFKHLCISANDCSCTIRWRCRATCATVGLRFCWNYKWDKSDTTCTPVRPDLCSPEPGFVCEP